MLGSRRSDNNKSRRILRFCFPHWERRMNYLFIVFSILYMLGFAAGWIAINNDEKRRIEKSVSRNPGRGGAAFIAMFNSYRPEKHYMRGPGPKWRECHDRGDLAKQNPVTVVTDPRDEDVESSPSIAPS
jgi:hypothetical protein